MQKKNDLYVLTKAKDLTKYIIILSDTRSVIWDKAVSACAGVFVSGGSVRLTTTTTTRAK